MLEVSHFSETVPMSNYFQCKTLFRNVPYDQTELSPTDRYLLGYSFTVSCKAIPTKGKVKKENKNFLLYFVPC